MTRSFRALLIPRDVEEFGEGLPRHDDYRSLNSISGECENPPRAAAFLRRKLVLDQPIQIRGDRRLIEPLNDFVQETGDDKALRDWNGNSTGAKIKKFALVDLTGSGAVGATNVVG